MKNSMAIRKLGGADIQKVFNDTVSDTAKQNFYGFDINPDLVKATKMNMVMNNDGSGNILKLNSLLPPQEWDEKTKKQLATSLGINHKEIRNHKSIGFFRCNSNQSTFWL